MKNSLRFLALAALVALPFVGRAQVTYTNITTGSTLALGSSTFTALQTFTGFTSLSSMTWQLTNTSGSDATASFNAYVVQWSGSTAVGSTLQAFPVGAVSTGTIGTGVTTGLTFSATPLALDSSLTYALVLSYASGSTSFVANFGTNPGGTFFASGGAGSAATSSNQGGFQGFLEGTGTGSGGTAITSGSAYTMSVTATPVPAPEPKTAAVGIAVLFVAALVGRRVMQRRKLAAPLAA